MNRIGKEMERGGSQVVDNVLLDGKAVDGIVSLALHKQRQQEETSHQKCKRKEGAVSTRKTAAAQGNAPH